VAFGKLSDAGFWADLQKLQAIQTANPSLGVFAQVFDSKDAEAIKAAVNDHVRAKIDEGGGVYRLVDTRTGEKLDLEFVDVALVGAANVSQVHNPVRPAEGGVYFACANFRPLGALKNGPRESLYDIDLSLEPRNGVLEVTEVFVHKEPRLVNGKWVRVPRAAQ